MAERKIKTEKQGGGETNPSQPDVKASSSTFPAASEGKGWGDVVDLTSSVDDDNDDDDDAKNKDIKVSPRPSALEQPTQHVTNSRGNGSDLSETRKKIFTGTGIVVVPKALVGNEVMEKNKEIKVSPIRPSALEQPTQHVTHSRGNGSDLSETRKKLFTGTGIVVPKTLVDIEVMDKAVVMDKVVMEKQKPTASSPRRPPPAAASGEPTIVAQNDVVVPAAPTSQKRTDEYSTIWTCDVCLVAQFKSFEEACEHEKTCTGLPPPPPQDPVPSSKITLFSPLLENGMNCINWYKISNYHQHILKSMKLMHSSTTGAIAFQCQYCSAELSPSPPQLWTTDKIINLLPNLVQSHIHHACKVVSNSEKERLADTTLGKISFDKFLKSFFTENGIVDKPIGPAGQTITAVIPEEEFVNMVGVQTSKRYVECRNKKSKETKKQKTSENMNINHRLLMPHRSDHVDVYYGDMGCKTHDEDGDVFTVAPLDGLPFLSTFTKDASKHLHPAARLMLQQLELFTISPELMKSAKLSGPSGLVGVRCRNTIIDKNGCCFVKLKTVDDLFSDIHRIVTAHLIGCRSMPAKDAKAIRKWMESGKEIFDPLTKFFNVITKLYSMQDSISGGVVWGDSPKVPAGSYSTPADIDISAVLVKSDRTMDYL
jgi:hypothetical protein